MKSRKISKGRISKRFHGRIHVGPPKDLLNESLTNFSKKSLEFFLIYQISEEQPEQVIERIILRELSENIWSNF